MLEEEEEEEIRSAQPKTLWVSLLHRQLQVYNTGPRHTGNGDQLSSTQAEPGQAIKSAVAYFPSISCVTSCRVALYSLQAELWFDDPFSAPEYRDGIKSGH